MAAESALTSTSAEESIAPPGVLRGWGRLGETGGSVTGSNLGNPFITLPASAHLPRSPTKSQVHLNAAWLHVPLRSVEDNLCMVCAVPSGTVGGSFRRGFEDQLDGSRPEVSRSGVILRVQDEVFCPSNLGFFPQTYTAEPSVTLASHGSHVGTTSWGRADLGGSSRAARVVDIGGGVGMSRGQSIGNVVEVKLLGSFLVSFPLTGQTVCQAIAIDVRHPLARHLSCLDDVGARVPAVLVALRDWVLKSYSCIGTSAPFFHTITKVDFCEPKILHHPLSLSHFFNFVRISIFCQYSSYNNVPDITIFRHILSAIHRSFPDNLSFTPTRQAPNRNSASKTSPPPPPS